jgi:hypothetical protein
MRLSPGTLLEPYGIRALLGVGGGMGSLKACPWFYPFQSNLHFQDLLRRMNFPS